MASRYDQGIYMPKNPGKYVGSQKPMFRSSWERAYFLVLDEHPFVINWASEPLAIPYINPLTGRPARYIPDILVSWMDKTGKLRVELQEIKPAKQSSLKLAKSKRDKLASIVNDAKWSAARKFCSKQGMVFRVLNEGDLFKV